MSPISLSGASIASGMAVPVAARLIPITDPTITGLRTGCTSTRRQDGRRPDSTMSSTTNATGASTTSWYSITGATSAASSKT